MTASEILDLCRREGLTLHIDRTGKRLVVKGPYAARQRIRPILQENKVFMLDAVSRTCARCYAIDVRLVIAYWGPRYCSPCCQLVTAEHDRDDSWPPVPWGAREMPIGQRSPEGGRA